MRNQNRIDVSFTQPLSETNNCVHRKKGNKYVNSIDKRIIMLDTIVYILIIRDQLNQIQQKDLMEKHLKKLYKELV